MKTILDVTVCTHSKGGVGRWVRGLSGGLSQVNREHSSIDLPETHPGYSCTVPGARVIAPPFWMKLPLLRRVLIGKGFLESRRAGRIEKVTGPADIIHLSGVQPEGRGKQKVVTFFDDTPWVSPESHTKDTLMYAAKLQSLINGGAAILTISDWSASVAAKLFNVSPERIGSAGGAADDVFTRGEPDRELLKGLNLSPDGYFLHVGSYVPRKSIPFLIRCFSEADTEKKLVLAGAEKWGDEILENTKNVVFLKSIPDDELLTLYRGATALLLPSSSEGLGLPVLEAFACGTAVISSDGGALPETVGRNGLILPVLQSAPWVKSIRDMASGKISNTMKEMAESAPRSTWSITAEKAIEFYGSLL